MRTANRWASKPGFYDSLHIRHKFTSDNAWQIPTLPVAPQHAIPRWLAPYRERIRAKQPLHDGGRHFFLDDYRFESLWHYPDRALPHLRETGCVLTPDFSLFTDFPRPAQIWNTYRNRWCGAFWVQHGLTVIPTVSWSDAASYDFCFAGIPQHSVVAISTVGILQGHHIKRHLFWQGLLTMIERLRPTTILCYGNFPYADLNVDLITYPTRWAGIRAARKEQTQWAAAAQVAVM